MLGELALVRSRSGDPGAVEALGAAIAAIGDPRHAAVLQAERALVLQRLGRTKEAALELAAMLDGPSRAATEPALLPALVLLSSMDLAVRRYLPHPVSVYAARLDALGSAPAVVPLAEAAEAIMSWQDADAAARAAYAAVGAVRADPQALPPDALSLLLFVLDAVEDYGLLRAITEGALAAATQAAM